MHKSKNTYHQKGKRTSVSFLFFALVSFILIGQVQTKTTNQKEYADSLFRVTRNYIKKGVFEKALLNSKSSLAIYEALKDNRAIGNNYSQIATIHYYQSEFSIALEYFEKSAVFFKKVDYLKGVASSFNNKGAIYYYLGEYPKALEHYKKATSI